MRTNISTSILYATSLLSGVFYSTFLSLSFEKINKLKTRKFQIANTAVTTTFAHWISSTLEFTNVAIITEVATILKILSNA